MNSKHIAFMLILVGFGFSTMAQDAKEIIKKKWTTNFRETLTRVK